MSKNLFKASLFACAALQGNVFSNHRVNALGSKQGVMRVDLERKVINHYESL